MTPDQIKALRRRLGMSQNDFGLACGLSSSGRRTNVRVTVSRWETGAQPPSGVAQRVLTYMERYGVIAAE